MVSKSTQPRLVWEELNSSREGKGIIKLNWKVHRARVPGGWLVLVIHNTSGITFYPDPDHTWDGSGA